MNMKKSSHFSIQHEWSLHWIRDGKIKSTRVIYCGSPKERALLKSLASVDVIGRKSMLEIFGIDTKRAKKMCFEGKIIEHKIQMGKRILCIYTLGKVGADLIEVAGYKNNYWLRLEVPDVLKRLMYYHLYSYLPDMQIAPAVKPFVGSLVDADSGNQLFVYILRGNSDDLQQFLKWEENFSERLIIVTESLTHVEPLVPFLVASKTNVRIAEDMDLYTDEPIQNSFYFIDKDTKQLIRDQVIYSES